jgi:hypothetical protein
VYALAASDSEAAQPEPRRRRILWAALASVLVLGVIALNRSAILAWVALTAPRYFSKPIEQKIGFAQTSDGVRIAYATTGQGPAIEWESTRCRRGAPRRLPTSLGTPSA